MPKFDFADPPMEPGELAHTLAQSCLKHNGLALSANQIGLRIRAFIIKATPMICMINPNIVGESTNLTEDDEGCLSHPGLVLKVNRSDVVRVRFANPSGEIDTNRYEGITCRIIQHELDHLNGILFTSNVSRLKLEVARKKALKASR